MVIWSNMVMRPCGHHIQSSGSERKSRNEKRNCVAKFWSSTRRFASVIILYMICASLARGTLEYAVECAVERCVVRLFITYGTERAKLFTEHVAVIDLHNEGSLTKSFLCDFSEWSLQLSKSNAWRSAARWEVTPAVWRCIQEPSIYLFTVHCQSALKLPVLRMWRGYLHQPVLPVTRTF